jgi:uncharacterized membrane protein YvlD (DUF360 family)
MKFLKWFLYRVLIVAAIIVGFHMEVEGVQNVLLVYVWFISLGSFTLLFDEVFVSVRDSLRNSAVPLSFDNAFNLCIGICLAFYGAPVTAIFWILAAIVWNYYSKKANGLMSEDHQ